MAKSIHRPEYAILLRRLKEMRSSAGLTQAEVSAELGWDQSFVSNIERGVRRIDLIELREICKIAGTTATEFVRELEEEISKTRRK